MKVICLENEAFYAQDSCANADKDWDKVSCAQTNRKQRNIKNEDNSQDEKNKRKSCSARERLPHGLTEFAASTGNLARI